jgi:hypothetical protein
VTDRYTRLDLDKLADVVEVIGANWDISGYYPDLGEINSSGT